MLTIQNKNIYNSKVFEKFINKLFLKGKKSKYLKIINLTLNSLKKSKLKPKFFFFLILEKLKPIFFFSTIKKKRKKKIKVTYKPFLLSIKQQYLISIKWFFLPLKKKSGKKLFLQLEDCFLNFLNLKKINVSLIQKKKTYLIILKYKRFIKF